MNKTIGAASLLALLALAPAARAGEFTATPLNAGAPTNLPGENLVPGLPEALGAVNAVTAPLLTPVLVPGGGIVAPAEPAVTRHHRSHHHRRVVVGSSHHHAHRAA